MKYSVLNYIVPGTIYWRWRKDQQLKFCWHNVHEIWRLYKWMYFSKREKTVLFALGIAPRIELKLRFKR